MTTSDAGDQPCGLLLVDKSAGPTSHDVVAAVRRALGERRVGHAGTLDPFATGLLACLVGPATRLARFFSASDKTYDGVVRFGFATDSADVTGRALAEPVPVALDDARVRDACVRLTGDIQQCPPMHSAKKRGGVALYQLAHRGMEVEREALPVRVMAWELGAIAGDRLPFRVTCSAGTYVRVLAEDLGVALGVPAHLESLRRIASGTLRIEDALPLADLGRGAAREALVPLDAMTLPLPGATLADGAARTAFLHGRTIRAGAWRGDGGDETLAVRDAGGRLLGVAHAEDGALRPDVVLGEE